MYDADKVINNIFSILDGNIHKYQKEKINLELGPKTEENVEKLEYLEDFVDILESIDSEIYEYKR